MRLVLSNPHIHQYGKTVADFLIRRQAVTKYTYFLDFYIKSRDRDVAFFIDGTRSSFNEWGIRFGFFSKFLACLELKLWLMINEVNPFRHRVYFNVNELDPLKDIIFNCSFTTIDAFARNNNNMQFHYYNGVVVHHLTHYFCGTKTISNYIEKIKNSFLVAEADLSKNDFFRSYFPEIKKVHLLPFTFSERFKRKTSFKDRLSKCFAIGTASKPRHIEFIDYFGNGTALHPMRQTIYDKKNELKEFIDCYIKSFDEMRNLKNVSDNDSKLIKIVKKYLPSFLLVKIIPNYTKEYFNFNIVEKYNEYQMFISPEEIVGLPSINVFEGMACGCAFVGIDDYMYADLGLQSGVHYIGYKNKDLGDLLDKIKYYRTHQEDLEKIAQAGYDFVRTNFSREKIADLFWNDLKKMLDCSINPL